MTLKGKHRKYDCADIEKLAQQYIDGALSEEEQVHFNEHIEYCLPCDKKIEFEQKLKEIIHLKGRDEQVPIDKIKSKLDHLFNQNG